MKFKFLHPSDQIVMFMDRVYSGGMTTMSGGNISILDEEGDIWITPSGIDKGTLTRNDICQVKPDGTVIGRYKPSVGCPLQKGVSDEERRKSGAAPTRLRLAATALPERRRR